MLKDYQAKTMELLWEGDEFSSREVWKKVNERLSPNTISRASIINFLNDMVDDGILGYREITGKGGHRRIYSAGKSREQFWNWLITTINEKLEEAEQ